MKLSAPVFRLKRQAKLLSREVDIPLYKALDRVARQEGFETWSLLAARYSADSPAKKILPELTPGDLVLLGARPGHGKTMMALQLIHEKIRTGGRGVFYSFEFNESELLEHFRSIGADPASFHGAFTLEMSDAINADFIIKQLSDAASGTLVVIDYLQLLDQKRENPEIETQVSALKSFANKAGLIIVFLSQVDRAYNSITKSVPDMADVRLPNSLDLTLFTKSCFLNDGEVSFEAVY
jgi:replicative DNA helicase